MAGNKDLFMELPQCLLLIIISFLPFKEAARTSILSKHWLNLWRATRNIEFDESFFVDPAESDSTKVMKRREFIDFVQQWIGNYCQPCIDKFAFGFSKPEQFVADIENFIAFAIAKNVKRLSLDFSDPTWTEDNPENNKPLFDLSSHVYAHEVLESLKLFSCKIDMPALKNFSLLKDLSLGWIELQAKVKTLLQYCPLLESLSLTKCWNLEHFVLSEPCLLLRKLVIDRCSFYDPIWIYIDSAPKLRFIKYSGRVAIFDLHHICCLEEADLDFGLESSFGSNDGDFLYNLLLDLFSVTILTACSYMLQDYKPLFEFNPSEFWTKNLVVHKCIRRTLKLVEVKGFKGTVSEFLVLQYLICLGRVMERMNLYISRETDDNGGNLELYRASAQMLLQLKKASKKLQISIY